MVYNLRSGYSLRNGYYDKAFIKQFLSGEYPNCLSFTLLELQQLKFTIVDNFDIIQDELAEGREDLVIFLVAQWRKYHEDLVQCSTPPNSGF